MKKLSLEEEKAIINKWICRRSTKLEATKASEQSLYGVNQYYDFYSGMTPYVEISFRVNETDFVTINSIDHPYISSLEIEDNGVKKATINLFDKDFASYQDDSLKYSKRGRMVNSSYGGWYSLETLIKAALKATSNIPSTQERNKAAVDDLKEDEQPLPNEYLKIDEAKGRLVSNLKIRYGYCDKNQPIKNPTVRDHRWFEFEDSKADEMFNVECKYKGNNLTLGLSPNKTKSGETSSIYSAVTGQTTVLSHVREYMIIGYQTSLNKNGISYTISAIEDVHTNLLAHRFISRYAELSGNPVEVLYALMRIFNEREDGTLINNTPKILFMPLNSEKNIDDLNMVVDTSNLSEEELKELGDLVETDGNSGIKTEWLKEIKIAFGSAEARRNYSQDSKKPVLYKNVSQLITEFCNACAAKTVNKMEVKEVCDNNGNPVNLETNDQKAFLTWTALKPIRKGGKTIADGDPDANQTFIILYYRTPFKFKHIRRYIWGPNNPYKNCIKNLSIASNNEFAVFSGISAFDTTGNEPKKKTRYNGINVSGQADESVNAKEILNGEVKPVNQVLDSETIKNSYDKAYACCTYNGTMELLGDPSLEFCSMVQPWTYPIKLDVLLPMNDNTLKRHENKNLKSLDKEFGSKVMANNGNQRYHETSGFYVITGIKHSISTSGYTTTLSISSYPNIEKEVLV